MNKVVSGNRADRAHLNRLGERAMSKVVRYVRSDRGVEPVDDTFTAIDGSFRVTMVVREFHEDPPFDEARTFERIGRVLNDMDTIGRDAVLSDILASEELHSG